MKAEQSATHNNDETNYSAGNVIDLDLQTQSGSAIGEDGKCWLKITLGMVHCVERVMTYSWRGTPTYTWTCTKDGCSDCEGTSCNLYILTVSSEETSSDLPPVPDCQNGDTVKMELKERSFFLVNEILIFGKQGNSTIDIFKL